MISILLIDGYNIIYAWEDVFDAHHDDLENNRHVLMDMLADYQGASEMHVILVFDAHMVKAGKQRMEVRAGLTVVYTGENETADHYIERFVYEHAQEHRIFVATGDYLQQQMVLNNGGVRVTPRELRTMMAKAKQKNQAIIQSGTATRGRSFMSFLSVEQKLVLERLRRKKRK